MNRRVATFLIALITFAAALASATEATPQTNGNGNQRSVWEGVYTEAQARDGQVLYETHCIKCHGRDTGGFAAKELYGDRFFERWREDTLGSLYSFMQNMPPAGPARSAPEYMNILSHILWANGFPSGSTRLDTRGLSLIRIEGEDGPQPLPDRAQVQVIGCMTRSGSDWTLTKASDPVRARNTEEATEIELKAAGSKQLGTQTFELGNFFMLGSFDRDAHEGHRMLAKGALVRQDEGDRISLTALDSVASTCEP